MRFQFPAAPLERVEKEEGDGGVDGSGGFGVAGEADGATRNACVTRVIGRVQVAAGVLFSCDAVPMTDGEEYRKRGFLVASRPLADPSVAPGLLTDEPLFTREIARMEAEGRRGIPYLLTDAIRQVAQDAAIVATVERILGTQEWVMWGPNIRRATPNQAQEWHVDLESLLWPTVTVAVGLGGCTANSATWCIAGTQRHAAAPPAAEEAVLAEGTPEQFTGFGDGRFYVFDARVWHRGEPAASGERVVLFLHYQRADEPRIPLLVDYYLQWWGREAAPYFTNADGAGLRRDVAQLPWRYRLRRWINRFSG